MPNLTPLEWQIIIGCLEDMGEQKIADKILEAVN
jgi:hypothetical protein